VTWLERDPGAPAELLDELIWILRRPGQRSFFVVIERIAEFLYNTTTALSDQNADRLVSAVNSLLTETDLAIEQNDRLYRDPAWLPDSRVAAAHLASVLWTRLPTHRRQLEAWRTAMGVDPLLRARDGWNVQSRDDNGS
jgi:hypothetical protein